VSDILKYLFPVPKEDSKRIITFANNEDYISFRLSSQLMLCNSIDNNYYYYRHHLYKSNGPDVELKEVGPRFELKLFEVALGTIDQKDIDIEWRMRPYLNTAKKNLSLSNE
jgi:U3 small nucleolar ribonucleoprotein protein IMP4